jgi:hypothetical protein
MPPQQRTYESIAARLRPPPGPVELLAAAAAAGDLDAVKALAPQGAEKESEDHNALQTALHAAAGNGHLPVVEWLHAQGADISAWHDHVMRLAVTNARLPILEWLHSQGADFTTFHGDPLRSAARCGHLPVIEWLHDHGVDIRAHNNEAVRMAALNGHLHVVKWLHAQGVDVGAESCLAMQNAAGGGQLSVVKWLHEQGADIRIHEDASIRSAARNGHLSVLEYLHTHGADIRACDAADLIGAAGNGHLAVLEYLHAHGADIGEKSYTLMRVALGSSERLPVVSFLHAQGLAVPDEIKEQIIRYRHWIDRHGRCPAGLADFSPFLFRARTFDDIVAILEQEYSEGEIAHRYAYHTAGLFGTTDRVLAYLDKWGAPGKQPLHDIIQNIKLPQDARFNIAVWADACLRFGPKMTRLVKFAGGMPEPLKDDRGQWSYSLTRAEIARSAYPRAAENPELSVLCFTHDWDNDDFQRALKHIAAYAEKYGAADAVKPGGRIPDIAIDGAAFGKSAHRFYKLPDGDPRGLLLGEFTNCCQHLAGAGSDCAKHGFRSKQSGFYVVADKKTDEIIAQSWAWRGTKDELVLDSLESLPGHMTTPQWRSLCDQFAAAARADKTAAVIAVHIGTGGATPNDMGYARATPAVPRGYDGYRDSKKQYVVTAP